MATFTTLYLPSAGNAAVTPSTWNHTNQVASPVTFAGVTTKTGSAFVDGGEGTGTTSPYVKAMGRWVIGPLAAQSISGTVNAVMMCDESQASANATMSIAVKIITSAGVDRAVLLANTASTTTNGVQEFGTTFATRRAFNAANTRPIPLTTQSASLGDYLVVEIGWRSATTTNRTISMRYGDYDLTNDLVDTDADTNNYSPWVAFSNAITLYTPSQTITPNGIATGEASGTPQVLQNVSVNGISTSDALGVPSVAPQPVTIVSTSFTETEALGSPSVAPQSVSVTADGFTEIEALGSPTVQNSAQPQTINANGIDSSEVMGSPETWSLTTFFLDTFTDTDDVELHAHDSRWVRS